MPLKSDFSFEDYKRLLTTPHSTRDNYTWDKVIRSSQSFWREVQVIEMVKNSNDVWEVK